MAQRVKAVATDDVSKIEPGKLANVPVEVVATTDGPVTKLQKVAKYYKGVITFVGTVLVFLTAPEIGPLQHLLPLQYQTWLTLCIGAITVFLTFMKANEHWFE